MAINLATDFIWNEQELHRILNSPSGPVGQRMAAGGIRCVNQAKINASGRPGPNVRTGRLRGSISWRLGEDSTGVFMEYGSAVPYARRVEQLYPYLRPALIAF